MGVNIWLNEDVKLFWKTEEGKGGEERGNETEKREVKGNKEKQLGGWMEGDGGEEVGEDE